MAGSENGIPNWEESIRGELLPCTSAQLEEFRSKFGLNPRLNLYQVAEIPMLSNTIHTYPEGLLVDMFEYRFEAATKYFLQTGVLAKVYIQVKYDDEEEQRYCVLAEEPKLTPE